MISFIIPAHNEERLIGHTLNALEDAARAVGHSFEVVVVDDASSDHTAAIAHAHGARVIAVSHRQIAATRNAGARQASGEMFVFLDADTVLGGPESVRRREGLELWYGERRSDPESIV